MKKYFIWGTGLLGGSIALELQEKGYHVFGCDHSPKNVQFLLDQGLNHIFLSDPKKQWYKTISECDGIIIATPVDTVCDILEEIEKISLQQNAWITDISSTKSALINWLDRKQIQIPFVASHPMTGSDQTGAENAKKAMFQSATIYMVESKRLKDIYGEVFYNKKIDQIKAFWRELGAQPYMLSPEQHDRWGAYLSHGLHLISCLTSILVNDIQEVFDVPSIPTGGSFRDITRVSGSNPELWEGIIQSNSHEVKEYLKRFVSVSNEWIQQLEENKMPVKEIFIEAQQIREQIMH